MFPVTKGLFMFKKIGAIASKLPSIAWVIILPLMLAAFIGSIIGIFWLLANVEGFASAIMVFVGWLVFRWDSKTGIDKALTAGGIVFYTLMGIAIDQPGNYFFNQPIEWWQCSDGTHLVRGVDVTHPLPGRTDMTQNYTCQDDAGQIIRQIGLEKVILVRFVEYVVVAYFFLYTHSFWRMLRGKRRREDETTT
jgi:hypothetical protein